MHARVRLVDGTTWANSSLTWDACIHTCTVGLAPCRLSCKKNVVLRKCYGNLLFPNVSISYAYHNDRWAVATRISWSVHFKQKMGTKSDMTLAISIMILYRSLNVQENDNDPRCLTGTAICCSSPAELPINLLHSQCYRSKCCWVSSSVWYHLSHRQIIESYILHNVFLDLWKNGILKHSQFWTHVNSSETLTRYRVNWIG